MKTEVVVAKGNRICHRCLGGIRKGSMYQLSKSRGRARERLCLACAEKTGKAVNLT